MDKRSFIFVLALTLVLFGVNIYFEHQNTEKLKEWNARQKLKETEKKDPIEKPAVPFIQEKQVSQPATTERDEKLYVIENEYQQLVFSNIGGALVEINLPFTSKDNQKSVVKETEVDREMVREYPDSALFPLSPYFTPGQDEKTIEHLKGKLGGYYPLLRRGLKIKGSEKIERIPPQYYATNIVSEYPEVAELTYEVKKFSETEIVFEANQPHRRITKTYSVESELQNAPYCINLTIQIEGDSKGLWLVTGIPEVEWISGTISPSLKYRLTREDKSEIILLDLPTKMVSISSIFPDWVCNSNGFFGIILDPLTAIDPGLRAQYVSGKIVPSRLINMDAPFTKFKPEDLPGYMMQLPLSSNAGLTGYRLFIGPFADGILKAVDTVYSNNEISYTPDYISCQSFHGWFSFISAPFAKFLFVLMTFFHSLTHSWGFSIILLTIALRLMLYPLNAWSTKSMLKMQEISPQVASIQEKHKKDPKKAQLEIMNLYREKGVNPLSGCFPILIQMPFLIGMFDLLKSTFELRGASFIPGWIDDLSAPDVLFSWKQPIFFIGDQFHLLPILLGIVMFLQQRLSSTGPKDVNMMTDQQRQQRAMGTIMAIVFTVMFYNFPSGLNIYWLSSMLLGILQQWWTSKNMKLTALNKVK